METKWPHDNLERGKQYMNDRSLFANVIQFNQQQQECYDFMEHWAANNLPGHLIVHGGAGVGKSEILKRFRYNHWGEVLVCA